MIFARVGDILHVSERNSWIDYVVGLGDERIPLMILGHRNRPHTELFDGVVSLVGFPFENAGIRIVGFLDLANNNGLEFAPRVLQIEVCLEIV